MARVDAVGSEEAVRGVEASPLTKTTLEKVGLLLGMGGSRGGVERLCT